ncbi:hypothetical protein LTR78_003063 [Recurvomyces mirabilis]|uniref:Uncharacterized protein n=1 Tax=Recurvomyces mirabilis TaxID=574656 RepID=A0AAE0WS75_9PEZI|nr:hypothetical protein LTR78_003063 [Recurvomyces mirabilis]KAK5157115.1 hypothetical protein LTS14_004633 [Recurvomyces mirabilis]
MEGSSDSWRAGPAFFCIPLTWSLEDVDEWRNASLYSKIHLISARHKQLHVAGIALVYPLWAAFGQEASWEAPEFGEEIPASINTPFPHRTTLVAEGIEDTHRSPGSMVAIIGGKWLLIPAELARSMATKPTQNCETQGSIFPWMEGRPEDGSGHSAHYNEEGQIIEKHLIKVAEEGDSVKAFLGALSDAHSSGADRVVFYSRAFSWANVQVDYAPSSQKMSNVDRMRKDDRSGGATNQAKPKQKPGGTLKHDQGTAASKNGVEKKKHEDEDAEVVFKGRRL